MRLVICAAAALLCGCGLLEPMTPEKAQQMQLGIDMLRAARPQAVPNANPPRMPIHCRTVRYGNTYQTVCD